MIENRSFVPFYEDCFVIKYKSDIFADEDMDILAKSTQRIYSPSDGILHIFINCFVNNIDFLMMLKQGDVFEIRITLWDKSHEKSKLITYNNFQIKDFKISLDKDNSKLAQWEIIFKAIGNFQ